MLCVAISVAIHAQGFDWVRSYTGQDYSSLETNKIVSSCADSDGNLYILGKFSPQASLCGVALLPSGIESIVTNPHFAANSGYGGVVIAKISPEGNLLWNKALFCTGNGMALDLRGIGDSAIMVMATIVLPFYQDNILQYNRLYYLDTLLAASNEDYLMPTDSMNSYNVNAFITIRNDGEVIEQHFLYVGWRTQTGRFSGRIQDHCRVSFLTLIAKETSTSSDNHMTFTQDIVSRMAPSEPSEFSSTVCAPSNTVPTGALPHGTSRFSNSPLISTA